MTDAEKFFSVVFGGILTLAIVSVIVGQKSQAPAAISAVSSGISQVVGAAVSPASVGANNGDNAFSSPSWNIGSLANQFHDFNSVVTQLNGL